MKYLNHNYFYKLNYFNEQIIFQIKRFFFILVINNIYYIITYYIYIV